MSPRARDKKERINKWAFNKIKKLYTAKENINKMKRENIFAHDTSDKGLTHMTQYQEDKQSN